MKRLSILSAVLLLSGCIGNKLAADGVPFHRRVRDAVVAVETKAVDAGIVALEKPATQSAFRAGIAAAVTACGGPAAVGTGAGFAAAWLLREIIPKVAAWWTKRKRKTGRAKGTRNGTDAN